MDRNLIYDVGANNGDDTAYYLSRGFRVIAIEASPVLASQLHERFSSEVAEKRLTILNVGVAASDGRSVFYINCANAEWSAFDRKVAGRDGSPVEEVEVECRAFGGITAEFGVPFYLKVDIEGNDGICLGGLSSEDVPEYLSIEAHRLEYLCRLHSLGYRGFKVVNQRLHPRGFPRGSSGPFGDDTPGKWRPLESVAYEWLHVRMGYPGRSQLRRGWYDFHATRKEPELEMPRRPLRDRVRGVVSVASRRMKSR